jgi:hypothetical protein
MVEIFNPVLMNWDEYDVPAIWAMVEPEQESANREQVSAWLRTSQMLASHQANLQTVRDRLTDRWPPEGSAAARQFLSKLDALVGAAREVNIQVRDVMFWGGSAWTGRVVGCLAGFW